MVALSMADGYGRITNTPQAVIVHVDVGTSALGSAVHNASVGRCPILVFAGMTPVTEDGSIRGSRTEYMHWIQNAPDQKALFRQYCRYVGEIHSKTHVKQTVARALQFAESDVKGPVYLAAVREVLAEEIEEKVELELEKWGPIGAAAVPKTAVGRIAEALVHAENPLIITGYSGRNLLSPGELVKLADTLPGLRVYDACGSDMCFPFSHPASLGFKFSTHEYTKEADVILILDCDVPWIPSQNAPSKYAKIFHIDADPLNALIPISFFPAHGRWKADSHTALLQLNDYLKHSPTLQAKLRNENYGQRTEALKATHSDRLASLAALSEPRSTQRLNIHQVGAEIKAHVPSDTVFVIEAVSDAIALSNQLQVDLPGKWLNCGGTGLGWSGGAALGIKLALDDTGHPNFVCQIVGDGAYLFSAPSVTSWIAARHGIPVLTIVLNNRGWNAPRNSMNLVHPDGLAFQATNEELHISFEPSPDYSWIAKAASGKKFGGLDGGLLAAKVSTSMELGTVLEEAVTAVKEGRGAVVEVVLENAEAGVMGF
jgi:thiamine pyrophosphate-dependent acetolactate synthase large subunit-like protein